MMISSFYERLFGFEQRRILFLGLDAAGKTTILYKLNCGEALNTIPTVGFNVERVEYKNIEFTAWDIGGQKKIRALWHHYFTDTDALVFIVDSCDRARFEEAKEELYQTMNDDRMRNTVLLVWANKQDLPNAASPAEVMEALELQKHFRNTEFLLQGCIATSGEGLYEGLDWLAKTLKKRGKPNH